MTITVASLAAALESVLDFDGMCLPNDELAAALIAACQTVQDESASSAPPAQPPALGDETGAGGTAPVDQPARNNNRGGRP